ncbi:MAG: Cna B-type domain-containing protein [Eubacterium sp.]|nr:Cna B-type domain-containing protein [Eubacterium sp.]
MGNAVKETQGRIFMKGKHEKTQFSVLLALALCILITVTFMPCLMFSSRAEESKTVSQITPPSSTSLTVSTGTSADEVKAKLPSSLSAKVTQDGQTETDETIDGITWSSDQYDADKAGTYTFTSALPSGYKLADGVSMPSVSVTVSAETKKSDNDPLNSQGKSYTKNNTKDAFLSSETFRNYSDSLTMGVAGYFHVVAFNQATLNAHTNGNILTHILEAHSNFGTNKLQHELSYIQQCKNITSSSVPCDDDVLVFGKDNKIGTTDGDQHFTVNGTKLDRPKTIIQDADTKSSPYIDLNNLKTIVKEGQNKLAAHNKNVNAEYVSDSNGQSIVCSGTGTAYYNMTATEFNNLSNRTGDHTLKITGLDKDSRKALVININCQGVDSITGPDGSGIKVYIGGQEVDKGETTDFSGGRVILNFYNTTENTNINLGQVCCQVIAPNANLTINNGNGNFIANNVTIIGETHRMDFTGKIDESSNPKLNFSVKKTFKGDWTGKTGKTFNFVLNGKDNKAPMPEKNTASVNSEGVSAEKNNKTASFGDITFTDAGTYQYTIKEDIPSSDAENNVSGGVQYDPTVYHVTVKTKKDDNGNISIDKISYTKDEDKTEYPYTQGDNTPFTFSNSSTGNEGKTTSIRVNKEWKDEKGEKINVPESSSIIIQLQQKVEGTNDDFSNVEGKTLTLSGNKWEGSFTDLPTTTKDGKKLEYRVVETEINGLSIQNEKADGYSSTVKKNDDGSFTITNTKDKTTPTSATATLSVTKNLIDKNGNTVNTEDNWKDKSFTFTLKPIDNSPMPKNTTDGKASVIVNSSNMNTVSFGEINYSKPGQYKYTITENDTDPISGVTYDTTSYTATVTVAADDMSVSVKYQRNDDQTNVSVNSVASELNNAVVSNDSAVFNNKITSPKPENTTKKITVNKEWKGTRGTAVIRLMAGENQAKDVNV